MPSGKIEFVKYAFAPNKLGYCGPAEDWALFEYLKEKTADHKIEKILKEFQGAYPYLELIAKENNISDPFDNRVVAAYWIGNSLLAKVGKRKIAQNIKQRFKKRIKNKDFYWLMSKMDRGAAPNHQFHVFDIFTKVGLLKSGQKDKILTTMNSCRISWGKIKKIEKDKILVEYRPLVWDEKIKLGGFESKFVTGQLIDRANIGNWVSIHWDWACDVLTDVQKNNLEYYTQKYIDLANLTL